MSAPRVSPRHVLLLALALAILPRRTAAQTAGPARMPRDSMTSFEVGGWGLSLADRDPAVRPGDNFFLSQNGRWFAATTLDEREPASAYWRDLRRLAQRRLQAILSEAAADHRAAPDSPAGMVGAFYRAFMDSLTVERRALAPLAPALDALRAARTRRQLAEVMGRVAVGSAGAFSVGIARDAGCPDRYAVYLGAGGMLLPGPEFYTDSSLADFRTAYLTYASRMLTALHWPEPEARARDIVALESRVARVSWSHAQMRDAVATYNPMTVAELGRLAPGFDWKAFLSGAGLGRVERVVVDARSAFPDLARIYAETPVEVWQAREALSIADRDAGYLGAALYDPFVDFRLRQFNSQQVATPARGLRAATATDGNLGDLIGALYVQRYFPPAAKARAVELAGTIRQALDHRLAQLTWMSPETRARARAKLAAMRLNIGYPDQAPDFRGLVLKDDDLYGDLIRIRLFAWNRLRARLDQPFDPLAGGMTPQTVNYNGPVTVNLAELPAGMLQPPFFDLHADPAVNYGGVGVILAQTMLSGFDDFGRHYEADGRLHDWWTPEENRRFDEMKLALAEEYSTITPLPGLHLNGELVANEAIGDLGGMQVALDAYHLSLHGAPAPVLDGFTGDQRFFLSRAQSWRAKFPPAFVRNQIATGRNAPPFIRVNGPVRHIDAWYAAFNVQPGDSMYLAPERRVRLW